MMCHEIEDLLPGYLDGCLSSEERRKVEEHLKDCGECRECLADLRSTLELAGGLEKISPPAHFTRDIMARVKSEAAGKREPGILQRLFSPLHVKIPLQVFATICISVVAFYLFRAVGPDVQKAGPEAYQQGKGAIDVAGEAAPAPSVQEAPKPAREKAQPDKIRAGNDFGANTGPSGASRSLPEEKGGLPSPASPRQVDQETGKQERTASDAVAASPRLAGKASANEEAPGQLLRKAEAPSLAAVEAPRDAAMSGTGGQEESVGYSKKKALSENEQAEGQADKLAMKSLTAPPVIKITLVVKNLDEGVRSVEKALADLHGHVVSRQMLSGGAVLMAEMQGQAVGDYVKKASGIGRMETRGDMDAVPKGILRVRTELKTSSE